MDDPLDSDEGAKDENKDIKEAGRFVPAEQRKAIDSTRRSDEERRQEGESFEGGENRLPTDRRKIPKRREMGLNVACKTSGSLANIEDWLDENCQSGWKVVLQRIDKDMMRKHLMVMFETEADRDTFLDKYLKKAE